LGHSFPVHFPQDNDFSSNSANVDVGRSRNTNFDFTSLPTSNVNSNRNGRVKGVIVSLEPSSSSEDDNDDHDDKGGGRRSSSPNKSQRNSRPYSLTKDQRHPASYSHSPNKTRRTLSSRGTAHNLFSFSAPSPGVGRALVPLAYDERVGRTDRRRRDDQIAPPSSI